MALTAGIFGLIGFMMWDRRSVISKAKEEFNVECNAQISQIDMKKADKEYVSRLVKAINELLAKDEFAKEVFKKYGVI